MLTLYVRDGCPFCIETLAKINELNLKIEEKNIADDKIAEELMSRSGKVQVPYLVDSDRNIEMFESKKINIYLDEYYGSGVSKTKETEEDDNNPPKVCTLEY